MKVLFRTACVMVGLFFILAVNIVWAELTVGDFTLVNSKRVSRVEYEYTYQAYITNDDALQYTEVSATVVSNSPYTEIVDNMLEFPDVALNGDAPSNDTFTIRHNRRYPFSWESLIWAIDATPYSIPQNVNISGKVLGGAPMVGTINIKDSSSPARFSYSGIGIDGSYSLDIDTDWQPPFLLFAEGYAGGLHMDMLSYIDIGDDDLFNICNVTPATTAIVAKAMDEQVDSIDPVSAAVPEAEVVEAIQDKVQQVLEDFFAVFDLPSDFNLFETPIEIGSGSDLMFDAVAFSNEDAENDVMLTSKSDPSMSLVISEDTTVDDAIALAENGEASLSAIEQFHLFFNTIGNLYLNDAPDLSELQSEIIPWCASGLIHKGSYSAAEMIELWNADPASAPPVGREFISCSIYRPMKTQYYGNTPVNEMPEGFLHGLWVKATFLKNGKQFSHLYSFVDIGAGDWRFYGNRIPFRSASLEARGEKVISPIGSIEYRTGILFWNVDVGNNAQTNKGITNLAIFNSAMPSETIDGLNVNCLRMERPSGGLRTIHTISNVPTQVYSAVYQHRGDGSANDLDLTTFEVSGDYEFVNIGLNDTGEPVHTWVQVLNEIPPYLNDLQQNESLYFASLIAPLSFSDVNIPGVTQIEWSLPDNNDLISSWSKLEWRDYDWNLQDIYVHNPAKYGIGDFNAFTSSVQDSSAYALGPLFASTVATTFDPAKWCQYRAAQEHNPWAVGSIDPRDGQVLFDVQKAYGDNLLSNELDVRIRATDQAADRFEADFTVDSAATTGSDVSMRTEVRMLYQPDLNWSPKYWNDLIIVGALIYYYDGNIYVSGFTWGSRNSNGTSLYAMPAAVGDYPFGTQVDFGSTNTLAVEYDEATHSLIIEFNGQRSSYDMSGLPVFNPANFKAAEIRTRVLYVNDPEDSGRIQVRVDNVRMDGVDYDDFNDGLGVNKWRIRAHE